ncbi:MAG: diacylglycerol kinase family protein [Clostridia bacterium]|nr:diacylglycerol kinase family protein [Clostridia bacterium]
MKYVFVVNPTAGGRDSTAIIENKLRAFPEVDTELIVSWNPDDPTKIVKAWCSIRKEEVCFVACGGDGTLHDVVNGAYGYDFARVGCYPCGSGNDFVKYYGGADRFTDLSRLFNEEAKTVNVDLIRTGDKYAINACHFGFDSAVARMVPKLKVKPYITSRFAYPVAVALALVNSMRSRVMLTVDGEVFYDGDILLCTIANGTHVGGSYKCAPRSQNDDGLVEVCLVKPVSRRKFMKLMPLYREGRHLDDPDFRDIILYTRAREILIETEADFPVVLDGEVVTIRRLEVGVEKKALPFVVPK